MDKKDAVHPQYEEMAPVWKMCRDASTGQRAVHKAGTAYLPRLSGQTDEEYRAYKARALYFNATGRTVEAMRGLAFRKKGTSTIPAAMKDWQSNITLTGKSLEDLARDVLEDTIKVGRYGLLVDYPVATEMPAGEKKTVAQAQAEAIRPYVSAFVAENILNWEFARFGSVTKLAFVTLSESYKDENGVILKQVRELSIIEGVYHQIVWRQTKDNANAWFQFSSVIPIKNGVTMSEIPFWFVGPAEGGGDVSSPPIEDLAYVNIAHYMNSADLENGLHISGLPTPYVTGVNKDDANELHLGSGAAWFLPQADCTAGFVQVGAEGFKSLENGLDRKEQQMAVLGARMIAPEKKAAEAAETATIRRSGESSMLADMVGIVSKKIEAVLKFMAEWGGIGGEVKYELNKNFLPAKMDAPTLTAWVGAVQSGKVSSETFFEALQEGEVVSENLTYADEQDRLALDGPPVGSGTGDNDNGQ